MFVSRVIFLCTSETQRCTDNERREPITFWAGWMFCCILLLTLVVAAMLKTVMEEVRMESTKYSNIIFSTLTFFSCLRRLGHQVVNLPPADDGGVIHKLEEHV